MSLAFDVDHAPARESQSRRLPLIMAVACIAAMAAVGARTHLVRIAPRAAVLFEAAGLPVNVAGLALDRVTARILADGDRRILVVEGDVVNSSDRDEAARPLAVSVRGDANEVLYTWITRAPQQKLAAGERAAFVARLASPPSGGASVVVEFDRSEAKPGGLSRKPESRAPVQGSRTESQ